MRTDDYSADRQFTFVGRLTMPPDQQPIPATVDHKDGQLRITLAKERTLYPHKVACEGLAFGEMSTGEFLTVDGFGIERNKTRWAKTQSVVDGKVIMRPALGELVIRPKSTLIGKCCFESRQEMQFRKSQLELTGLESWLETDRFDRKIEPRSAETSKVNELCLRYTRPPCEKLNDLICEEIKFVLHFGGGIDIADGCDSRGALSMRSHSHFVVVPNEPQDTNWFAQVHRRLQWLLSILLSSPSSVRRARLFTNVGDREYSLDHFWHEFSWQEPQMSASLDAFLPRSSFSWLDAFRAWFSQFSKLERAAELLVIHLSQSNVDLETDVIRLTQCFEALDGVKDRSTRIIEKGEFKRIRRALLGAVPDGTDQCFLESLERALAHSNSRSLRSRMLMAINELEEPTRAALLAGTTPQKFIKCIVDARNYFIHGGDPGILASHEQREDANCRLYSFLLILMIKQLDVPEVVLADCLGNANTLVRPSVLAVLDHLE